MCHCTGFPIKGLAIKQAYRLFISRLYFRFIHNSPLFLGTSTVILWFFWLTYVEFGPHTCYSIGSCCDPLNCGMCIKVTPTHHFRQTLWERALSWPSSLFPQSLLKWTAVLASLSATSPTKSMRIRNPYEVFSNTNEKKNSLLTKISLSVRTDTNFSQQWLKHVFIYLSYPRDSMRNVNPLKRELIMTMRFFCHETLTVGGRINVCWGVKQII